MLEIATTSGAAFSGSDPEPASAAAARCAAIDRYQILDTPPEPDFDDIAKLAATICKTPFAAIAFVDAERLWFKAEIGLGIREAPIAPSFCARAITQDDVFVVEDAALHPEFAANPLVTAAPRIRFYAGMPVFASDGTAIATLCVVDTAPRPEGITSEQRLTLRILAAQVEARLELRRTIIERDSHAAEERAMSLQLRYAANHDSLTGLPNRNLFHTRLDEAVAASAARGGRTAMMLVDLDHFKQVNDSMGHDAGDALLCDFAGRLQAMVRATDTVARLGGNEFGIVLTNIGAETGFEAMMVSLGARMREPYRHHGRVLESRASVGIASYPDHALTAAGLMKCGDLALAAAKVTRGCAIVFRPEMAEDLEQGTLLLATVWDAIEADEIMPHYQPKIDLASGAIAGFEALLRWEQPTGAIGLPEMFVAAFADRELAIALGARMIDRVLDDVRRWVDAGIAFGHVAINASAADFAGNDFAERLLAAIALRGLSPGLIELEVTEGVFLGRAAHHVARALSVLNAHGIRIALDDFGTGYASLTHLRQFPVHALKIDRSFVAGLGRSADDAAIVRALITLGTSLGIETVAEGIETFEQASFVRSHGCTLGQGFLFGTAIPARDVAGLIANAQPRAASAAC